MSAPIHYSDGTMIENPVIVIWEDLHTQQNGYFRAFWSAAPDGATGSPVIGYCSPGGSHRTIRAAVAEVARLYPDAAVYRNGRLIRNGTIESAYGDPDETKPDGL